MKRVLSLAALALTSLGLAQAATIKIGDLPLTAESNPKLLVLTDAGIRRAFPSAAGRPDAVFLSDDRKVSVAFEWREGKLAMNEVDKLTTQYPPIIKAQIPNIKTLKSGVVQVNGRSWAQFIFTTPGQGDDLRRELLMTSLGGRVLVLTIAANVKDYSRNETLIKTFVDSVKATD